MRNLAFLLDQRRDLDTSTEDVVVVEQIGRVAPGDVLGIADRPGVAWVAVVVEWLGDEDAEHSVALDLMA